MLDKLNLELAPNSKSKDHSHYILMDDISQESCRSVIEWIFSANFAEERPEMLSLIISSGGGDLSAAFAVIDVMKGSAIPVRTIGLGEIASAGLLIFMSGEKGQRVLTPNTSILSHQYSWGAFGKEHELFARVKEYDNVTKRLLSHYKKCTGMKETKIKEVLLPPQDAWLTSAEALEYGICDHVKDLY